MGHSALGPGKPFFKHVSPPHKEWAVSNCFSFLCRLLMMHILNLIFSEYAIVALDVWATQFLTIPRTMFGIHPRRGCTESLACHLHASHDVHTHCDTCVSWNSCTLFLGLSALGLRRPFCEHYFTSDQDLAQSNYLYFFWRHAFSIADTCSADTLFHGSNYLLRGQ